MFSCQLDKKFHMNGPMLGKQKLCKSWSRETSIAPVTCLVLSDKSYACNFGCDVPAKKGADICAHYIERHTREELESWSMCFDLMVAKLQ